MKLTDKYPQGTFSSVLYSSGTLNWLKKSIKEGRYVLYRTIDEMWEEDIHTGNWGWWDYGCGDQECCSPIFCVEKYNGEVENGEGI